jgi:HAMP domain-containing protein
VNHFINYVGKVANFRQTATLSSLEYLTNKMAATDSSLSTENPAKKEDEFNEFYSEVRKIQLILPFL